MKNETYTDLEDEVRNAAKNSISLVEVMKVYADRANYEKHLRILQIFELELLKDFDYWFNHYYVPNRESLILKADRIRNEL